MELTGIFIAIGVNLVLTIGAIAYGYGRISKAVDTVCTDLSNHKKAYHYDMGKMHEKVNLVRTEVAELKGEMKAKE